MSEISPSVGRKEESDMNTRIMLLTILMYILGMVALFCIFSEPADDSQTWMADLIKAKTIGIVAGLGVWLINRHLKRMTINNTIFLSKRQEPKRG